MLPSFNQTYKMLYLKDYGGYKMLGLQGFIQWEGVKEVNSHPHDNIEKNCAR